MNSLVVERAGLLTTVQDEGRWGLQHLGVPVSGWMDGWSARLANRLAGNRDGDALLEVTWVGPTLRAEGDLMIAIAGAVFDVIVGGRPMSTPVACPLADGDAVEFGARRLGARAYLAVRGGITVAPVLGSRATDVRSGLGGLDGRRLQKGDRLPVGDGPGHRPRVTAPAPPAWLGTSRLRVLPVDDGRGPADRLYVALCAAGYRLAAASDRTGYRLEADRPLPEVGGTRISRPVVTGAVQLPPGGTPLLLMADRQTVGGYDTVGVVASADMPVAAQLGPGDTCGFSPCTRQESRDAAADRARELDAIARRIQ